MSEGWGQKGKEESSEIDTRVAFWNHKPAILAGRAIGNSSSNRFIHSFILLGIFLQLCSAQCLTAAVACPADSRHNLLLLLRFGQRHGQFVQCGVGFFVFLCH